MCRCRGCGSRRGRVRCPTSSSAGTSGIAWTRQKAERALGAKLDAVTRGHRKPKARTFADLAVEFETVALASRPRKKTTVESYTMILSRHLRPAFDHMDLERLSRSPEEFERYAATKMAGGLAGKT